jgi:hypothetical protein
MAIDNEEHGALGIMHQPLEELQEDLRRGTAFVHHEAELPGGADRRGHVQRETPVRGFYHRRLAHWCPGGAGLVVREDARLIGKQNRGANVFGLGSNGGKLLVLPALDQDRVTLHGRVQRALGCKAQGVHHPPHRRARQAHCEALLNQFADQPRRPGGERKLVLLGLVVTHRSGQPGHLLARELRRTAQGRPGLQRRLPAARIGRGRQPSKHGANIYAVSIGHALYVPHEETVFSIFEPQTEWINKGTAIHSRASPLQCGGIGYQRLRGP